jgi:uncharacterized membrane protein
MKLNEKDLQTVYEIIEKQHDGDKNSYLISYRNKIIFIMVFVCVSFMWSLLLIQQGVVPIFTTIVGLFFLIISLILISFYKAAFKELNK